ncbi:S8 family serine peptidase [Chryseobacterium indologenes]|uniref:S8 family serine peptidase n=1 Tax=Chryseobacterium indologenes TaxID=253 RepID=UPI0025769CC1|nr:S8 family serine peptidase [Chryseobacterium indologenes]MDM1555879.1 S8 family serine peptidase [Chryseobacterium indologenes]
MGNKFIYLNNEISSQIGFDRQRKVDTPEREQNTVISEDRKRILRNFKTEFIHERRARAERKTIQLTNVELIRIHFFKTFDNTLHRDFLRKYGISPIEYTDFNRTILFQIENTELFTVFLEHIDNVINSGEGVSYHGEEYNLLALVYKFSFYSSEDRTLTFSEQGNLISFIYTHLGDVYNEQKDALFNELRERGIQFTYFENTPYILEIHNISPTNLDLIVDNFDIVKTVISSRVESIRRSIAGPIKEYGFAVNVDEDIPLVGVIDTGIARIIPFENIIDQVSYNHTPVETFWDEEGHGTLVSGLIVLGDDFYKEDKAVYNAKAKIINIKALHRSNDELNIPLLIDNLREIRRTYGVKLFNMSLVLPNAKKYNSSYSRFAYELDKLAHEEDLIVFISVGNFDAESLELLKGEYYHENHDYPTFFYSLNSESESHMCEDTNICSPAESLNNISIGAIADNLEEGDNSDVTPSSLYPAHYTRKFHIDFNKEINGVNISRLKNKNLNKPDFIMEGGDLFALNSGINILTSPLADVERFYGKTSGTSLATPLLTSYASEILRQYPNIRTQTIKAILINSSSYYNANKFPHFNGKDDLLKSLIGFGKPSKHYIKDTDNNSIVYILEKEIQIEQIIKYPIFIPQYMRANGNKLKFDISLAYSFDPKEDNHLNYLPLHMSFCIVKNVPMQGVAGKKIDYGIKGSFSWSEDHFGIDNRIFSNAQKKSFTLQPHDIINVDGSVAFAIRCLAKTDFKNILSRVNHPFSVVIRITELISNENEPQQNLYTEMMRINAHLDIENDLDAGVIGDLFQEL